MSTIKALSLKGSFIQLCSILFFTEIVRSAFIISFLPAYASNVLGISVAAVGLAVSIHYIADTAIKTVAGYLLDRLAPRFILHASLLLVFAGLWLSFFIGQPWALITGAALMGLGASPIWLICLSSIEEDSRGSHMGIIYTVWLAALGIGPVAVNFVLDSGYRMTFWLLAAIFAVGWLIALGWNRPVRPIPSIPVREQLVQLRLKLKTMKPLLPGMVVQTAAAGLLVPILPTFAHQYLQLSYTNYSFMLIAGGAATTLFLIPMGRLSDRFGRKWFLVVGFALLAVSMACLLLASSKLYWIITLAVVLGASYAAVLPAWNALMSYYVPEDQKGTGWGVLSSIEGIGVMVGPVAGGWIASMYGEGVTVAISASLLLAIALLYVWLPVEKPQ
ncbi:MFS transporter [Paenibacillus sp. YYML68]|uniref:MFS transporter n=1 Tax=Paenibacillus sp. YYML68 TaxID=2909250 RepID=UPI00248FD149|nr:MFS transporter [Paenibacillus sp. YYML68]